MKRWKYSLNGQSRTLISDGGKQYAKNECQKYELDLEIETITTPTQISVVACDDEFGYAL